MINIQFCKVLIVETKNGNRFFYNYNKKSNRISTAWHLSGAKLFPIDFHDSQSKCYNILRLVEKKGYKCYFKNLYLA